MTGIQNRYLADGITVAMIYKRVKLKITRGG